MSKLITIIYILLSQSLIYSMEILKISPSQLPNDIQFEEQDSLSPEREKELIDQYKKQLYQSESYLVPAQVLFALFEKTGNYTPLDILADFFYENSNDMELGLALYQQGAKVKSPHCLFKLARIELSSNNTENAFDLLRTGARQFDNYCLCMLAQKILDGTFKEHHSDAKKYLMISAQQGFAVAISELATYLTDKKYGPPHYITAYSLLLTIPGDNRAQQQLRKLEGNKIVQYYLNHQYLELADVFATGKEAPQNIDLAISCVRASTLPAKAKKKLIKEIQELTSREQ
mgnify:CR=1 FL=1